MESRTSYHLRKRKNKNRKIFIFWLILLCLILIFCFLKMLFWDLDNNNSNELKESVGDSVVEKESNPERSVNVNPPVDKSDDYWDYVKMDMMNVDFNELMKKNSDTVGFIKVNGTNINYPVVQSSDNDFYLNHAYDKTKNGGGWIYADYRNDMVNFDKNTIIYGHGRVNTTMFGSLKNILDSDWYNNKDNYIVKFSTPTENTLWQVFSVYSIPVETYYLTTYFASDSEYDKFLQTLKGRSKMEFSASVGSNDKIITLSTCKDTAGDERVVMHAKLIKLEER